MLGKLVKKVVGSRNQRLLKQKNKVVSMINSLEPDLEALSDADLRAKTDEFRSRLDQDETLDKLLPEAFAVVREAAKRVLGMRHFDVQLIGGMVLNDGKIAEMKTGEGKTLVATLAAYLNALPGEGVHVVTVNDYLAQRDAAWMGQVYEFLGLTTGVIISDLDPQQRQLAYQADITYGTNNEFGFDYLRDNMAFSQEQRVQRGCAYAIIDEVDSILIDEARTPLIISGPTDDHTELYQKINLVVPGLTPQAKDDEEGPGDYSVDEKGKQVLLTEAGHERVEALMVEHGLMSDGESLYEAGNIRLMHHVNAALRAMALYQKDVDYIVTQNEVVIVDEFTGRTMTGRRWSDGLHQAVEAKEEVPIQNENQTLASITFQNYFRLYNKLSGMTGTADTEAFELQQIYSLEVVVMPTHHPMVRNDQGDLVYLTVAEKYEAIKGDVQSCVERGQPVLVGTASVDSSEYLSDLLRKSKVPHEILNAKQHEREAHIIAQAGRPGAVTIATNMAGRGTDIVLGGNLDEEIKASGGADEASLRQAWKVRHQAVLDSGGLHVIGTERHESRRVDNQLRGRSGRQGDPGSTRFYLSLEDNLMRIFASDRVAGLMKKLGMEKGESIEHPWVSKAIANAQRKVEAYNFDIRKQLLDYDDVANDQRKVVYEQRSDIMGSEDLSEIITDIRHDVVNEMIDLHVPPGSFDEQWDVPTLEENMVSEMAIEAGLPDLLKQDNSLTEESLRKHIHEVVETHCEDKETVVGGEVMRHFEKSVMLQVLDNNWKEHLAAMDYLRQGIHLRGYAQKDPKQEYKREAFEMFGDMLSSIKTEVTTILSKVQVNSEEDVEAVDEQRRSTTEVEYQHADASAMAENTASEELPESTANHQDESQAQPQQPFVREDVKIGRNEPCPCGSGKKYKACHGRLS